MHRRLTAALVWAAATVAGGGPDAVAQTIEYRVKAGFLHHLIRFTRWPSSAFDTAEAPLHLCVIGGNPFGRYLEAIDGRRSGARSIAVCEVALDRVSDCHILFVSRSENGRLDQILAAVADRPTLTVADIDRFAARGGAVNLVTRLGRVRLEVNPDAVRRAGLNLSAAVLQVAKIVRTGR